MIKIKSLKEIDKIKNSAYLLVRTIKEIKKELKPGVTSKYLSDLAEKIIIKEGGLPAFKNYKGYPESICVSLNDVVIHGIPSNRVIEETDLVSIDIGVNLDGYFSDAAFSLCMKKASKQAKKLTAVSEKCLDRAIKKFKVGGKLFDISNQIQIIAEKKGYSVVREFVGHGIGVELHEDPQIPNFGKAGQGPVLKPGMVFAIEVMINQGSSEVEILDDGWTTVTRDGSLSAHFEHTVYLSEDGPRILTV